MGFTPFLFISRGTGSGVASSIVYISSRGFSSHWWRKATTLITVAQAQCSASSGRRVQFLIRASKMGSAGRSAD